MQRSPVSEVPASVSHGVEGLQGGRSIAHTGNRKGRVRPSEGGWSRCGFDGWLSPVRKCRRLREGGLGSGGVIPEQSRVFPGARARDSFLTDRQTSDCTLTTRHLGLPSQ